MKKKIFLIVILLLIGAYFAFRNMSFDNTKITINSVSDMLGNKFAEIAVPKYSFDLIETDNNLSIKNLRSNKVLTEELNEILSTYEKINCNEKEYYYDREKNYTIVEYGINDHTAFNTIHMKFARYNYCDYLLIQKYQEKLGGARRMYTFGIIAAEKKNITITFTNSAIADGKVLAELKVLKGDEELEDSVGTIEIIDYELRYTRTKINKKSNDLKIPTTSTFTIIENGVFELNENYLSLYEDEIILK